MHKKVRINLVAAISPIVALALIPGHADAGPANAHSAKATGSYFAYIGTYTETGGKPTGSKGIYLSHFDTKSGHFTPLEVAAGEIYSNLSRAFLLLRSSPATCEANRGIFSQVPNE